MEEALKTITESETHLGECFKTLLKDGDIRKCSIGNCTDYSIHFGSNSGGFCHQCEQSVCESHITHDVYIVNKNVSICDDCEV